MHAAVPVVPHRAGWGWALPIRATVAVVAALKLAPGFAVSRRLGILFAATLHPLVARLFWTWLWGVRGMRLKVALIASVRVVAPRVEPFKPVAELRGN